MHVSLPSPLKAEYEAIPYVDGAFPHAHPGLLAAIGTLFGMNPAPVERCRVLEVGCANGTNLLPLAELLPGSEFVGIDLAESHIHRAKALANDVGVENASFEAIDLMDFDPGDERFDYIIAHGVFSWVPDEVKEGLLDLCARLLSPQGIAYVSYNVYPGWSPREPLREILKLKTAEITGYDARIRAASEMLHFLDEAFTPINEPYAQLMREQIRAMRMRNASAFYYDEIAPVNNPCYFLQFVEKARTAGLEYLGDSVLAAAYSEKFTVDPGGKLHRLELDHLQIEQLLDFLHNRAFRTTLLCQGDVPVQREMIPERVKNLRLRSCMKMPETIVMQPGVSMHFQNERGRGVKTAEPWVKSFLHYLTKARPGFVPWEEAIAAASDVSRNDAEKSESLIADAVTLTTFCLANDLMQASTVGVDLPAEVPSHPRTTRVARELARRGNNVVNLLHELIEVDDAHREVIARLDGAVSRESFPAKILEHLRAISILLPD